MLVTALITAGTAKENRSPITAMVMIISRFVNLLFLCIKFCAGWKSIGQLICL